MTTATVTALAIAALQEQDIIAIEIDDSYYCLDCAAKLLNAQTLRTLAHDTDVSVYDSQEDAPVTAYTGSEIDRIAVSQHDSVLHDMAYLDYPDSLGIYCEDCDTRLDTDV